LAGDHNFLFQCLFFYAGKVVSAAVSPHLSINLLNRSRARAENLASTVPLPVAVRFLGQEAGTVLSFTIIDDDDGFGLVLGIEWERWAQRSASKGLLYTMLHLHSVDVTFAVPCPLPTVDLSPDIVSASHSSSADIVTGDIPLPSSTIESHAPCSVALQRLLSAFRTFRHKHSLQMRETF
jgi:hypothetical protein